MALISVTRLRLRSPLYLPLFIFYALPSIHQAEKATGNRGVKTRRLARNVFWTLTAWEDEANMRAYMSSGAHKRAMPWIANWCDEASLAHWQQDRAELPPWHEAEQRLTSSGRITRLPHPSPTHVAGMTNP